MGGFGENSISVWPWFPFLSVLVGTAAGRRNPGSYLGIAPWWRPWRPGPCMGTGLGVSRRPGRKISTQFGMSESPSLRSIRISFAGVHRPGPGSFALDQRFRRHRQERNRGEFAAFDRVEISCTLFRDPCAGSRPIYVHGSRRLTRNTGTLELDAIAAVVVGVRASRGFNRFWGRARLLVRSSSLHLDLRLSSTGTTVLIGVVVILMAVLNEWTSK
jgi:hypothetical protein